MQIQPLIEGRYFHIYSRGVNSEDIFKERRNYFYFLEKFETYCSCIMETIAYTLQKNHFHLLVYIKENVEVPRYDGDGTVKLNASRQLSHFFNSYSQSINKAYNRTGPLFESPFKRRLIDNDGYLKALICYCHQNSQYHGHIDDFKDWEFSSYHAIATNNSDFAAKQKVLEWFGGRGLFEKAHEERHIKPGMEKFIIE